MEVIFLLSAELDLFQAYEQHGDALHDRIDTAQISGVRLHLHESFAYRNHQGAWSLARYGTSSTKIPSGRMEKTTIKQVDCAIRNFRALAGDFDAATGDFHPHRHTRSPAKSFPKLSGQGDPAQLVDSDRASHGAICAISLRERQPRPPMMRGRRCRPRDPRPNRLPRRSDGSLDFRPEFRWPCGLSD
jgi:hypothetical protein